MFLINLLISTIINRVHTRINYDFQLAITNYFKNKLLDKTEIIIITQYFNFIIIRKQHTLHSKSN